MKQLKLLKRKKKQFFYWWLSIPQFKGNALSQKQMCLLVSVCHTLWQKSSWTRVSPVQVLRRLPAQLYTRPCVEILRLFFHRFLSLTLLSSLSPSSFYFLAVTLLSSSLHLHPLHILCSTSLTRLTFLELFLSLQSFLSEQALTHFQWKKGRERKSGCILYSVSSTVPNEMFAVPLCLCVSPSSCIMSSLPCGNWHYVFRLPICPILVNKICQQHPEGLLLHGPQSFT